jgi:hypothetical protein
MLSQPLQCFALHRHSARQARAARALGDSEEKIKELYMVKGDSKKPRGKMSSWIFFVQTFRRTGSSQGFILLLRVSKEYSEMWETMSCKDKGKLGDMPKQTRLIMKEK